MTEEKPLSEKEEIMIKKIVANARNERYRWDLERCLRVCIKECNLRQAHAVDREKELLIKFKKGEISFNEFLFKRHEIFGDLK